MGHEAILEYVVFFEFKGGYKMFKLGKIVITSNAAAVLPLNECYVYLLEHKTGNWGNLSKEDKALNDEAIKNGGRILSCYKTKEGIEFWIITEADRSVTTILLPEDY